MQAPAHSFWPVGQLPPQAVPSQVAVPPAGTGQGTQAEPQLATSLLATHCPVQLCVPGPQTSGPPSTIGLSAGASTPGRASVPGSPAWPPDPEAPPDPEVV
jgi:hypothetical protein